MADVSNRLRAARERAGLRIEDISATTKIKVSQLQAIERGEFERLPGEFFTRAFLRTYARELHLPPDEIVREYEAERADAGQVPEPAPIVEPPKPARVERLALPAIARPEPDDREFGEGAVPFASSGSVWPVVALAVILLVGISMMNRQPEGSRETGAASASGNGEVKTQPAGTAGQAPAAAPPAAPPATLAIEISPSAVIWINAKADGELALYRLVQPGERVKLEARNELTFRIGNAAAFHYAINGAPGRVLGGPDEVREFQITRENYRTYLR